MCIRYPGAYCWQQMSADVQDFVQLPAMATHASSWWKAVSEMSKGTRQQEGCQAQCSGFTPTREYLPVSMLVHFVTIRQKA